jgi:hypothetical protein
MTPEQLSGYRLASFTVESEVSRWKRFARPGFLIEFSYPEPTPNGQAVDRDEKSFRGYARVHLSSRDRRELYLEVVRFHDLTPEDEYLSHKPYLAQRFGADSISSLIVARYLTFEYLPRTAANVALTDIVAQHPNAGGPFSKKRAGG